MHKAKAIVTPQSWASDVTVGARHASPEEAPQACGRGMPRPYELRAPETEGILAIVGLGVLLSSLVLAAGCQAPVPKEAAGRDVVRSHLGFALDVAKGWNFKDLYGDVVLEIFPQPPPGATPLRAMMDVVVVDRGGMGLSDWAEQAIEDSHELQSDLEVVSRSPAKLADGREALLVVLKSPRGVQPIIQRMLLAMTERRAYAMLATAPESDLAAAEPEIRKTFDSFIVW